MTRDEAAAIIGMFHETLQAMPEHVEIVRWEVDETGTPHMKLKALTDEGREFLKVCFRGQMKGTWRSPTIA